MNLDDPEIISAYGAEYRGWPSTTCSPECPRLAPAAVGSQNLDAQDAGRQAPLDGDQDGP